MTLFWVTLWSTLPHLALLSDRCTIHENDSPQIVSSLLESLECHNDYQSYVQCKWKEGPHINTPLQLFSKRENIIKPCEPYGDAVQDADKHRIVKCRFKDVFAIHTYHTLFFVKNKTLAPCPSAPHKPLDLSHHLSARPPVNLSRHDSGDGGWRLIWSSPYPSSSSLSNNLKYQLSYRPDRHDNWIIENVISTNMKLEKRLLRPGCRYEARVRARASVGQWSDWSPAVTWRTEEDAVPSLHCVLDGEKEVMCSWEVSEELTHFITYQLACRHNHSAPSKRCCVNQTVTGDLSGSVQRYSCSLNVTDPAHLLLELIPTRNAKTFIARQHILPDPPQQVKVRENGNKWIVEWNQTRPKYRLHYQVCYYMTQHQAPCTLRNISDESMSLTIPSVFLAPSQQYQVKVRSLIAPGHGSEYMGKPSAWTDPVGWTSHAAGWSYTSLVYFFISVFVVTVFCTLYYTIPACQRRVILWVESVPSPGKSKILSEIKSATSKSLMQNENTYICKVAKLNLDSLSTCSSDTSLWPTKDSDKKHLEQYRDCWNCDNLLSPAEKVNGSDTSSMSFSGPYILCQTPEPKCNSEEDKCEEKRENKEETSSHDTASASPTNFTLYGEGYVCLPNRSASRSTQDLVSHSDANTSTHRHDNAEQDQQRPDNTPRSDKVDIQPGLSEPTSGHQPPAYTSGPFTPWPQGDTVPASGYCLLPKDFMKASQ